MNIALGALVLFLLISPGISFRIFFLKSDSLKSVVDTTVVTELLFIIIPSFFLQIAGATVIEKSLKLRIRIDQFYYIIIGSEDSNNLNFDLIKSSFSDFLFYSTLLVGLGALLGKLLQYFVSTFNLDRKNSFLQISNDWEKLFNGRYLFKKDQKKIEFVQVDVVCSSSIGDVLYCGILEKFTLNRAQGLDKIYLSSVYRRKFENDQIIGSNEEDLEVNKNENQFESKSFDSRYYNMPGDFFVIPYNQIKNINVTYYYLVEQQEKNEEDQVAL